MADDKHTPADKVEDSTRTTKDSFTGDRVTSQSQQIEEHLLSGDTNAGLDEDTDGTLIRPSRFNQPQKNLPSFGNMYETLELLGVGGMSMVYKIRHKVIGKIVAAKMLQMHLAHDDNQIKRFEAEAKALFALQHPNIVSVREFAVSADGKPYLLMDYLDGRPLNEELRNGPLPVTRALKLMMQACEGLEHAHMKGIVHRDIKPSNIILTADEQGEETVKLVDFGIAKLNQDATGETIAALTATGDIFGSPPYMSPEQCSGAKLDTRSDIYSFGCVMYEMFSGAVPFQAESAMAVIHKHNNQLAEPLAIPDCEPRLRHRLDEIIFKALEKNPEKRYQSMADLRKDLAEVAESTGWTKSTGVYLKYTRTQRKMAQRAREHPIAMACLAAGTVALIAIASSVFMTWDKTVAPLRPRPAMTYSQFQWRWGVPKVESKPFDFDEKVNIARVILTRRELSQGDNSPDVLGLRLRLAQYYMKYGEWDEAISRLDNLKKAYLSHPETYDPTDIRVGTADAAMGDCLISRGAAEDISHAADYYRDALEIFLKSKNSAFDEMQVDRTHLKLARILLLEGDVDAAQQGFLDLIGNIQSQDLPMLHSGLGDCALATTWVSKHLSGMQKRNSLDEARKQYVLALNGDTPSWEVLQDQVNCAVAALRIIDTHVAEGDYKGALDTYYQSRRKFQQAWPEFSYPQREKIAHLRASLLWHTGHYLDAMQNMPDDKHVAQP